MKLLPMIAAGPVSMESGLATGIGAGTFDVPVTLTSGSIPLSGSLSPVLLTDTPLTPVLPGSPLTPSVSTGTPVIGAPKPVTPVSTTETIGTIPAGATTAKIFPAAAQSKVAGQELPKWVKPLLVGLAIAAILFLGYKYFLKGKKGK